jgi:hypothetical protein
MAFGRIGALLALVTVLAAGCTDPPRTPAAASDDRVEVLPTQSATATRDHLRVTVPEGAVEQTTTLALEPAELRPPERAGFTSAGPAVEVSVGVELQKPVTLTFDGLGGPADGIPVIYHYDAQVGWYPIEAGDPGGAVTTGRLQLSPFAFGWISTAADWLGDVLVGRQAPAKCSRPAPAWASLVPPKIDITTACLSDNPEGTTSRAEVRIKSNRGLVLEVAVPAGVAYAAVDGQSELIRSAVRGYLGRDSVLLLSGQEMTVGWRRPEKDAAPKLVAGYSPDAILIGVTLELVGIGDSDTFGALAAFFASCANVDELALDMSSSQDGIQPILDILGSCLLDAVTSPGGAAAAAVAAVAALNRVDGVYAAGDKLFATQIDKFAGVLKVAGKALKWITIGQLAIRLGQAVLADRGAGPQDRTTSVKLSGSLTERRLVTFNGYGGIRIGMNHAQAVAAAPEPVKDARYGPCDYLVEADEIRADGLRVLFGSRGAVLGIDVPSGGRTDRGIAVGSSMASVRSTYKDLPIEEGESVAGHYIIVTGPTGTSIGFHSVDGPNVETMTVGIPDFARGYELCSDSEPPE